MPHMVLEYSSNVIEKNNFDALFAQCHTLLENKLPTKIANCESKAIECTSYYVGNGQAHNACIHVSLKIMSGRSVETLNQISEALLLLFKNHFAESFEKLNLHLTLEINELPQTYFKINS